MDVVQLPQGYRASLLFTIKFPEILGTHLIDLREIRDWANLSITQ